MAERPRSVPAANGAFDYRTPGVCFVARVTQARACCFGEAVEGGLE